MPEKLPTQALPLTELVAATVDVRDREIPIPTSVLASAPHGTMSNVVEVPTEFIFRYRPVEDDDGHPDGAEFWCDLKFDEEIFDCEIPAADHDEIAKIHQLLFQVAAQHGRQVLAQYYYTLVDRDMDYEVPELDSDENSLSARHALSYKP